MLLCGAKKAIEEYNKALAMDYIPEPLAALGYVYGKRGDRKAARGYLDLRKEAERKERIAYLSPYYEALIFAGLKDTVRCLDALDKAYEQNCDWLIFLNVEPRWAGVRSHQRFHRLVERVGITPRTI